MFFIMVLAVLNAMHSLKLSYTHNVRLTRLRTFLIVFILNCHLKRHGYV